MEALRQCRTAAEGFGIYMDSQQKGGGMEKDRRTRQQSFCGGIREYSHYSEDSETNIATQRSREVVALIFSPFPTDQSVKSEYHRGRQSRRGQRFCRGGREPNCRAERCRCRVDQKSGPGHYGDPVRL